MDISLTNHEKNKFICPNCNSLIISQDFTIYNTNLEKNLLFFANNLYSNIKSFQKRITIIINNIKNISCSLEKQINHSKSLVKLIAVKNNNYMERYLQLNDRIDMMEESTKLLNDNLSLINENTNIFINDINQIFNKMKNKLSPQKPVVKPNKNYNNENINLVSKNECKVKDINTNKSVNISKKILSLNLSPKNQINDDKNNNYIYRNFNNIVNNLQLEGYNKNNNNKSNNTLIFPNNINQNIFNYTITSREFKKLNKAHKLNFYNNKSNNLSRSKDKNLNDKNKIKYEKMLRSSSIPNNNRYENNVDYNFDGNSNNSIKLCYKVKEFIDYLNDASFEKTNIFFMKIQDINDLINSILEKNNYVKNSKSNRLENYRSSSNSSFKEKEIISLEQNINFKENYYESLNNIKILTEKIDFLNNKIREKEEYIKYIKKNSSINKKNETVDKNKKYIELNKENSNLKNELSKLQEIEKENQKLKNKIKEINDSQLLEINQKEQIISKLNESMKIFEEENKSKNNENNMLKEKIEEYKNNLMDKNKKIQEMNTQINNYSKEINELNIKLKNITDESQLVMEISSLKKINNNLNKKLNDLKKKLNPNNNNNNINDDGDSEINKMKENYEKISGQNKDLIDENNKIRMNLDNLKKENNKKEEELKKFENIINELKNKINEKNVSKNRNLKNLANTDSFSITNSIGFDIVNNNESQNLSGLNIEDFKKQNEKLIKIKEQFNKYRNEKQIEISIYKNEFETSKKEIEELKNQLHENNIKIFSSEQYNILCDKNYKNLQWFLLIPKSKSFNNTYDNLLWVPRKRILNIENYNEFETENEIQNKLIKENLLKLEKKEEIISKLKYKLNYYEKNINHSEDSNKNIDINAVGIEKMNNILNQLNDTEKKLKILQEENLKLKEELSKNKPNKNKMDDLNKLEDDKNNGIVSNFNNDIINNKTTENENEEENEEEEEDNESQSLFGELRDELENTKIELDRVINECEILKKKFIVLKERFSNLLIKMKIPKKHKDELSNILKILGFSDNEILFIVDKKKLF